MSTNANPNPGNQYNDARAQAKAASAYAKASRPWYAKKRFWLLGLVALVAVWAMISSATRGATSPAAPGAPAAAPGAPVAAPAPATTPATATVTEGLVLEDGWKLEKDSFMHKVNGYVKNNSDRPVTGYASITFDALDEDGNNVGTCVDNINSIDANGRWKFSAVCLEQDVASVRFKEITHF